MGSKRTFMSDIAPISLTCINTDIGTLEDVNTGAETERTATGVQVGYNSDAVQFSSAIEYRSDDVEQLDLGRTERKTWLLKNSFKYQVNPGARRERKLAGRVLRRRVYGVCLRLCGPPGRQ